MSVPLLFNFRSDAVYTPLSLARTQERERHFSYVLDSNRGEQRCRKDPQPLESAIWYITLRSGDRPGFDFLLHRYLLSYPCEIHNPYLPNHLQSKSHFDLVYATGFISLRTLASLETRIKPPISFAFEPLRPHVLVYHANALFHTFPPGICHSHGCCLSFCRSDSPRTC